MTKRNYKLYMKFCTDGDFGWSFVPTGMIANDYEEFELYKDFETVEEMQNWASTSLTFLVNNITGREYIVQRVVDMLNNLKTAMLNGTDYHKYISGNYEGTQVDFVDNGNEVLLHFSVPEDVFKRMKNCDFNHDDFISAMKHMLSEKENNI